MNKFLCIYFIGLIVILYWNTIVLVQIDKRTLFVTPYTGACYLLDIQKVPSFSVLRRTDQSDYTSVHREYTRLNCNASYAGGTWDLIERPMVGDHIHIGMVLSVNHEVLTLHDRDMSQPISYEAYPLMCPNPGIYAYEKRWYHTGVHTHCDGIVHVHPWSAPSELRVEGRRVRLKLWFESVGIEVSPDKTGLKMPGEDEYIDEWTMEYYVHAQDSTPILKTNNVEEVMNLWLVDHHGLILLWTGGKPEKDLSVLDYDSHPNNYPKRYV